MLKRLVDYALTKPEASATFPFGPDVLVVKVLDKMFMLANPGDPHGIVSLKCDPERAMALREAYPSVKPGYHLNKRHWNTVILDGTLEESEICRMIDHSFELVVKGLPKAERARLAP